LTSEEYATHFFWPNRADIAADVRRIFSRHISLNVLQAHPDDKLVDDLRMDALDSMSTIGFVVELEKYFDIDIPDKAAAEMRTLNDLTQFIAHELRHH
jgi:acyl carrier protein